MSKERQEGGFGRISEDGELQKSDLFLLRGTRCLPTVIPDGPTQKINTGNARNGETFTGQIAQRKKMKVTVAIPTYRRPELLRIALASVNHQSYKQFIKEVIVSENSTFEGSRLVCDQFPDLPIRYLSRTTSMPPVVHFRKILEESECHWVAWLADDDIWGRYHLEEAARSLALRNHDAFISNCAPVNNESMRIVNSYTITLESLAWPTPDLERNVWNAARMHLEALTRTPFSLWGLVSRRELMLKAVDEWLKFDRNVDGDRIFLCALSATTDISVGREINLMVRVHSTSATETMPGNRAKQSIETTREIMRRAEELGLDLKDLWRQIFLGIPVDKQNQYLKSALPGTLSVLKEVWGKEYLNQSRTTELYSACKDVLKNCTPPIILGSIRAFMQYIASKTKRRLIY